MLSVIIGSNGVVRDAGSNDLYRVVDYSKDIK